MKGRQAHPVADPAPADEPSLECSCGPVPGAPPHDVGEFRGLRRIAGNAIAAGRR
jgi:hypothetical protein